MGISMNGFDELIFAFDELSEMPDSVLDGMLEAGAKVVERVTRETGESYGVHRTGATLGAIGHDAPRKTADGKAVYIYPKGSTANGPNKTKRNAEVAYINEYGKKNQPPRPFMRDGAERAAGEAVQQEEQKFNDYLTSKGL